MAATAVLLGAKLRDLGGKFTTGKPCWRHPGAKFDHCVGDGEAKSGRGSKQHFGPRLGPNLALLRHLKATVLLFVAGLGVLRVN